MNPYRFHWVGILALTLMAVGQIVDYIFRLVIIKLGAVPYNYFAYFSWAVGLIALVSATFWAVGLYLHYKTRLTLAAAMLIGFLLVASLVRTIQLAMSLTA